MKTKIATLISLIAAFALCLSYFSLAGERVIDDFEGDKLNPDIWDIVEWVGTCEVELKDGRVSVTPSGSSRAGILSKETFNGDDNPVTITAVGGQSSNKQAHLNICWGTNDWQAWEYQTEWTADTSGAIEVWIVGAGGGANNPWSGSGYKETYSTKVDGKHVSFLADGKVLYEQDVDFAEGDFKVFLYSYSAVASWDAVKVSGPGISGMSVEPMGKLAITWASIKSER